MTLNHDVFGDVCGPLDYKDSPRSYGPSYKVRNEYLKLFLQIFCWS